VGIALDIIDYLGIGLLPILGDLIDLAGIVYFWQVEKLKYYSLIGAVEFIPLADILPTFTFLGILAGTRKGKELIS
jgi:hypothetical protein